MDANLVANATVQALLHSLQQRGDVMFPGKGEHETHVSKYLLLFIILIINARAVLGSNIVPCSVWCG